MKSESKIDTRLQESEHSGSLVERLAEKLSAAANVAKIFGEPIDRDGTTIIPVAKVRYGFGGGGGGRKDEQGSGGGGGVQVTPYGYIEIKNGSSEFRRITGLEVHLPVIVAGGVASLIATRAISRLVRRQKNSRRALQ
jgi:uncharacterized spore protein YtfJ